MKTHKLLMLMFASAAILLAGCEKDNTTQLDGNSSSQQTTTYTIEVSGVDVPSGMALEFVIFEYSASNEKLEVNRFNLTSSSMTRTYSANERTEKVKIAWVASVPSTGQSATRWVQQVFYLDKGSNTIIKITGNTTVGTTEP